MDELYIYKQNFYVCDNCFHEGSWKSPSYLDGNPNLKILIFYNQLTPISYKTLNSAWRELSNGIQYL